MERVSEKQEGMKLSEDKTISKTVKEFSDKVVFERTVVPM